MASSKEELDAILDSALDELEEEELRKVGSSDIANLQQRNASSGGKKAGMDVNIDDVVGNMKSVLENMQDPAHAETLENTLRHLSSNKEGDEEVSKFIEQLQRESNFKDGSDVDKTVAETLQKLAESSGEVEGVDTMQAENIGEDIMSNMMKEFQNLGDKGDLNEVVDGMMRQLLSKELMLEPMKQVRDKFPEWLAEKKSLLTEEEYTRYGNQYQSFQRIVAVYETEPDNFERLVELMQDLQEFGQPPSEIIKGLAPGLEFNEDGMPIMPNMPGNMMPTGAAGGGAGGGVGDLGGGGAGFPPGFPIPSGDAQNCVVS